MAFNLYSVVQIKKVFKGWNLAFFMGKTIGIVSLKGGVGKTSVAAALGSAIADLGKKVLLVDANLSAPNLGLHLNVVDPEKTLHHVLMKKANPSEAVIELERFDLLPATIFENVRVNPLLLRDKIKHFKRKYDFIILDSSPALNNETLAAMLAADDLFIVTTPDHPTLSTTVKAAKLARQRGQEISGLILNKVYGKDFELSLDSIEDTCGLPVLAIIPHDINVAKSVSKFKPFTEHKRRSSSSKEVKKLAEVISGEKKAPTGRRRYMRFFPKRQDVNREIYYENVFG